jgi:hypothetical protein
VVECAAPRRQRDVAVGGGALAQLQLALRGARLGQAAAEMRQVRVRRRRDRGDRLRARGVVQAAGTHRQAPQLQQRVDAGLHAGARTLVLRLHRLHRHVQLQRARPGTAPAIDLAARERGVGLAQRRLGRARVDQRNIRPPLRRCRLRLRVAARLARGRRRRRLRPGDGGARARASPPSPQAARHRQARIPGSSCRGRAIRIMGLRPSTAGDSDLG